MPTMGCPPQVSDSSVAGARTMMTSVESTWLRSLCPGFSFTSTSLVHRSPGLLGLKALGAVQPDDLAVEVVVLAHVPNQPGVLLRFAQPSRIGYVRGELGQRLPPHPLHYRGTQRA